MKALIFTLLRFLLLGVLAVAAIVGLFVAWWLAVFGLLGLAAYVAVRRLIGPKQPPAGSVVVEGEYVVERDGEITRGRVIEVKEERRL